MSEGSTPSSPISALAALSILVSNLPARGLLPPAHFQTFYPGYPELTPIKNGPHRFQPITRHAQPRGVSHIRRPYGTDGVPPNRRPWKTRR